MPTTIERIDQEIAIQEKERDRHLADTNASIGAINILKYLREELIKEAEKKEE